MKKILAVSLVAIMAAGAARADIASTQYVKNKISDLDVAEIKAENEVILSVSETDGKISATTGKVTADHLSFDVATQAELDAVIGTKDESGNYTDGLGKAVAAAQGTADDAMTAIGSYNTDTKEGTGLKKQVGDIEEKLKSVATTEGLGELTSKVEANETAIGTKDESGNYKSGLGKAVADNTATIGTLSALETDVKTSLVDAINEVDQHADAAAAAADAAQGAAEAAQGTANSAMTAIGGTDAEGNKTGLVKAIADEETARKTADGDLTKLTTGVKTSLVDAINEVDANADAAATAAATAQSAAETAQQTAEGAQATADLKVNKSALGINDTAENPFEVPDWCKGGGVVCSFVVLDGVAGWQKVVDVDPVDPAA